MRARGMTLLELLVVVTVLAALSALGWSTYAGVREAELDTLGQAQLRQTAQAFRRFHADMGYWPGEGPLALAPAANAETLVAARTVQCSDTGAGLWVRSTLPSIVVPAGVVDVDAWEADWAAHPANLWQLVMRPVLCANHPLGRLQDWSADAARGWRGPYLPLEQLGWLAAGNGLQPDGSGSALGAPLQSDLRALPAGRRLPPLQSDGTSCPQGASGCAWQWSVRAVVSSAFDAARDLFAVHPRPLLYFGPVSGRARLVWVGPDGEFGGLNPAGAAQACEPVSTVPAGLDDSVICLD